MGRKFAVFGNGLSALEAKDANTKREHLEPGPYEQNTDRAIQLHRTGHTGWTRDDTSKQYHDLVLGSTERPVLPGAVIEQHCYFIKCC